MGFLNERERRVLTAAATHLLPDGPDPVTAPGVNEAGVVDYVDQLPSALDHDPPRIWAGGPISDRAGQRHEPLPRCPAAGPARGADLADAARRQSWTA